MRLDILRFRLSRLEQYYAPEELGPWPPAEGIFSWCLYQERRQPAERMGFWEMYEEAAKRCWAEGAA